MVCKENEEMIDIGNIGKPETIWTKIKKFYYAYNGKVKVCLVGLFLLCGIEFFHRSEGWDYVDCAYFITVTVTTVGYGNVYPTNDVTRGFTIIYAVRLRFSCVWVS